MCQKLICGPYNLRSHIFYKIEITEKLPKVQKSITKRCRLITRQEINGSFARQKACFVCFLGRVD